MWGKVAAIVALLIFEVHVIDYIINNSAATNISITIIIVAFSLQMYWVWVAL